jgi:UDP-N-acetylmuramoyl-tripeptide--D-alanyl-D-alanine ligase
MTGLQQTSSLWHSKDAAKATGGISAIAWNALGVSIDSRTVERDDLFIAISGPNFDGHNYVHSALENGAAAAVIAQAVEGVGANTPLLKVSDTFAALEDLGRAGRDRSTAKVIAVTGSVGKTGVKEALGQLLSEQGETSYSRGSFNNQFGVPLSLARLPQSAGFAVFELGMNHAGELTPLSQMVRPIVAIVTTVEPAHIEFFSSVDDIARAKAEIFNGLEKDGTAILNRDNAHFELLSDAATAAGAGKVIGFGAHHEAQYKLLDFVLRSDGSTVEASFNGYRFSYQLAMPGRHWVMNSLAVLAAVEAVGADVFAAARAFGEIKPPKGRGERLSISLGDGSVELIDDSYNASPVSIAAALEVLAQAELGPSGRRIAALGDMRELGDKSAMLHQGLAAPVIAAGVDLVYAAGPEMKHLCDALPATIGVVHTDKSEALIQPLLDEVQPGDVVLVKGSAGSLMGQVVEALKNMVESKEILNAV